MIYLLTDPTTEQKTILVSTTGDLPFNNNNKLVVNSDGTFTYIISNNKFAQIFMVPKEVENTSNEVQNILNTFFKNSEVKKFNSTDSFSAYLIYIMSNK
jgi:hypothetical protein